MVPLRENPTLVALYPVPKNPLAWLSGAWVRAELGYEEELHRIDKWCNPARP
jgi:hypothetical protein